MVDITDAMKVQEVVKAFETLSRSIYGQYVFVRVPSQIQKRYSNCLEVYNWCKNNCIDLGFYFIIAFSLYGKEWCKIIFKRPFPPFNVASSLKTLEGVKKQLGNRRKVDRNTYFHRIISILKTYPKHIIEPFLESGILDLKDKEIEYVKNKLADGVL